MDGEGDKGDRVVVMPKFDSSSRWDHKYLLLSAQRHGVVGDGGGAALEDWIVVSHRHAYHSDILDWFNMQYSYKWTDVEVCGGGILIVDEASKLVGTFGQSGGYGQVSKSGLLRVTECLKAHFDPTFRFEVTATDYVRG